jgi:phosphoribosylformylglycinamidine synthase
MPLVSIRTSKCVHLGPLRLRSVQCFNIELTGALTEHEARTVAWLLRETYEPANCASTSFLSPSQATTIVEFGPRLTFSTAWSANAVSTCAACGVDKVARFERSWRYAVEADSPLSEGQRAQFAALVHDRMTEEVYAQPLRSFKVREPRRSSAAARVSQAPACAALPEPCRKQHVGCLVVRQHAADTIRVVTGA